jgi:hypothetical protein
MLSSSIIIIWMMMLIDHPQRAFLPVVGLKSLASMSWPDDGAL